MKFEEISEKEYEKFWEKHPLKTFLSSPKIGKLRQKSSWDVSFVGVKEKKKLIGAAMLLSHKRHFGKYEFYSPRGFLIDYQNSKLLQFFIESVKKYVKAHHGYILRMDPYVIYKERDIDGNIVEGGEDNTTLVENLLRLGFQKVPVSHQEQVSWMFSLDLEGKTEEQILKEMKPNTRNTIRKAEKFHIDMRELSFDELGEFQSIMEETGARKNFSVRDQSYFEDMYQLFHDDGEVKFYITELNLKKYLTGLEIELKEKQDKMNHLSDAKYNDGAKKNLENEIISLEKRIADSKNIMKETGKDVITLSGSMFMLIQPEVIYLSSGNYEEYMKFNSQYLIQWELIRYGIKNGFKKHNFYGIPADINTHPKDYGIYEFKRGFNGYVEELIGEYECPITWHYHVMKLIHKIKK